MRGKRLYLFFGYGSEYVLSSAAGYLAGKGEDVMEIDMLSCPDYKECIRKISGREIVFITSAHVWADSYIFEKFYYKNNVVSALEVMDYLKPVKSYFYPHELGCFFHQSEKAWMDLFDGILLPFRNNDYYELSAQGLPVYEIGWIKKKKKFNYQTSTKQMILFAPSGVSDEIKAIGEKGIVSGMARYVDRSVKFKYPVWEGYDELIAGLRGEGFTVLDSRAGLDDLLEETRLVIGNRDSSIIFEAANCGFPTVSLSNSLNQPDGEGHPYSVPEYNWVYRMKYSELPLFLKGLEGPEGGLLYGEDRMEVFDYKHFYDIVGS